MEKITTFLILYNEEKIVERALESIKPVVDEILVVHDGPCSDNTLKICRKYTKKIFIRPHKGRASIHIPFVFKKAKYNWLLKIDADEYLSKELIKNIRKLIENPKADAYAFLWRWWNGEKYLTKNFPHKLVLFRKSKVSFLEFPGNDEPEILGKITKSNLEFKHKPLYNKFTWSSFFNKGLKRAKDQAKYTLKNFNDLEKFQYHKDDFKLVVRLRRKFPILSIIPFSVISFFRVLLKENAWKEGWTVFRFALQEAVYQGYVCYYIHKLKNIKKYE